MDFKNLKYDIIYDLIHDSIHIFIILFYIDYILFNYNFIINKIGATNYDTICIYIMFIDLPSSGEPDGA